MESKEIAGPGARLTGSRIRERRLAAGTRQADLARAVGISPAYLNLIEHNRRRIGGKLLVDLARALEVEPTQLSEGAQDALLAGLQAAGARHEQARPEQDKVEEFVGRFPGWAAVVTAQARRVDELERLVESLSDRLAHDPHLAASLHEVVTAVTAIRSAASILAEPDIDADWRARFVRNVSEESRRLSESAEGLVAWLDSGGDLAETPLSPVDELGAFVTEAGYRFPALEGARAGEAEIEALIRSVPGLTDAGAAGLARTMLYRYLDDVRAMPAGAFDASRAAAGGDPARIAAGFGVGLDAALRRIASRGGDEVGLVTCDGTGALILRKPVDGFALPRFGAGCGLWPLFQALSRPAQPVAALVEMPGRMPRRFLCRAVSVPVPGGGFGAPQVHEATMLIEPAPDDVSALGPVIAAGTSCRICSRDKCPARREPSLLGDR
ncbi:XRE family transcriptional regulator [Sinisalibacter aestuarii]|uniref:XRE family transcriptional regulator n=1 Tax=Sinisalibacter aestuarii TaxID=2949426 RepID=A0ABQ5LRA0_9RHOB|nr:XRE family transcriptional regulator [Sinisalibacter aestuarii]GKY87138.1 XRE family transcriptional regulator [Sinisalibacter aestuarii]